MEEIIDNIINTINSHSEWDTLLKMRYAFLELGKNVHKDARFFYSLYNVLGEKNYSRSEIEEILSTDEFLENVTCHNSAKELKYIFDHTGIESKIVNLFLLDSDEFTLSDGSTIGVKHCFVAAKDDSGRDIILTLNHDLTNIQVGKKTANFGKHVTYINPQNGKQIYEGEELNPYVVPQEKIREMDEELGYLTKFFSDDGKEQFDYTDRIFDAIKSKYANSKDNLELLSRVDDNEMYKQLIVALNEASGSKETEFLDVNLSKISSESWNNIKKIICEGAIKRAKRLYIFTLYDEETDMLNQMISNGEYRKAISQLNDYITCYARYNSYEKLFSSEAFIGQTQSFLRLIDEIKEVKDFTTPRGLSCKNKLHNGINSICKFYIDPELIFPKNYDYSNDYIINKLSIACPLIFDLGEHTELCNMGIVEQMAILDQILSCILPELKNNTRVIDEITVNSNPNGIDSRMNSQVKKGLASRIKTAALYDKETNSVNYLIYLYSTPKDSDRVLIYDFKNNIIKGFDEELSLFDVAQQYVISSNKLSIAAEETEDIKIL